MEDDAGRAEGDFDVELRRLYPVKDFLDVALFDGEVVTVADGGLEEHADGVRQFLDAGVAEGGQLVEGVRLAGVLDGGFYVTVEGVGLGGGGEGARCKFLFVGNEFVHVVILWYKACICG